MFELKKAIIPIPAKIEDKGSFADLGICAKSKVNTDFSGSGAIFESARQYLLNTLNDYLISHSDNAYKISLSVNPCDERFSQKGKSEAYFIDITQDEATLCGYDEAGAYYACVSFARLIHISENHVLLPECFIMDYPYFKTRSHFMECRYGSDFMTLDDWKKAIDYLADMKINKLTIGLYGCWSRQYDNEFAEYQYIPFKKYPELKTPRSIKYYSAREQKFVIRENVLPTMYEEDYLCELIAYAKTKNIEIIPLFNSLGHNTLIPRLFPEISAVDENGEFSGLGFCTNNEKTYEIMFDLYDEIIDRYLKPNDMHSFQIGLDEVWKMIGCCDDDMQKEKSPFCQCEKCRGREYGELMFEYIIRIAHHMKEKGIKNLYVYHDMLFNYGILTEKNAQRLKDEGLWDIIVIDWWSYVDDKERLYEGRSSEVNNFFRSVAKPITGYYHWTVPTETCKNIDLISEIAADNNFEGMSAYSAFEYCYDYNYNYYAQACWNPDEIKNCDMTVAYSALRFPDKEEQSAKFIELAHEFMNDGFDGKSCFARRIFDYYQHSYLLRGREYPQNYPSDAFTELSKNEALYINYLSSTKDKAAKVKKYFDGLSSKYAEIWKLNAAIFETLCDEFLTIYTCAKNYNSGKFDEGMFIAELERLIASRDKAIYLCEKVRIKANQYTLLRNMTVIRQFMCDLLVHINTSVEKNEKPHINIFEFDRYLSDLSWYLR